jgi:hypothetical protein
MAQPSGNMLSNPAPGFRDETGDALIVELIIFQKITFLLNVLTRFCVFFMIKSIISWRKTMNKLLTFIILSCLTLLSFGSVLAAPHNFRSDFYHPYFDSRDNSYYQENLLGSFENWYYIEKNAPATTLRGSFSDYFKVYGAEYFKNDQTFVNLSYTIFEFYDISDSKITNLKGSYLFDNNFFVGLTHQNFNFDSSSASLTYFSPGYRFNFPSDSGYLTVSLDYYAGGDGDHNVKVADPDVLDYEINGRYYIDRSRFYGQVIIFNKDLIEDDYQFYKAGGAYQCFDNLVLGADVEKGTDTYTQFEIGGTANFGRLGADFKYCKHEEDENDKSDYNLLYLNILYSFTDNLRAGLEVMKIEFPEVDEDIDPLLIAKVKYTIDDQNALILMHDFENDNNEKSTTYLYWDIKLP